MISTLKSGFADRKGVFELTESIIVSLVGGFVTLTGVILTNSSNNRKLENQLTTNQAVTNAKLEETNMKLNDLAAEVKENRIYGDRITRLETSVEILQKERNEK